jgi:caffeoyl-CoA O-methyltransferase
MKTEEAPMSARTLPLTPELRDYLLRVGVREPQLLARLREETAAMPRAGMQICPEQGAFMTVLARLLGVRRALEIGTFTGYSSLALLAGMPGDGAITTLDVDPDFTAVARRYWQEAGVADRVELVLAPAIETLDRLVAEARTYDLAFVDADKENMPGYYERCLALLRPGGVVLIDNVLWDGRVADPANEEASTVAIRALNEAIAIDDRVDVVMIPVGDGLTLARKR